MAEVTEMPPIETPETPDTPTETPKPAKTSTTKKPGRPPSGPEPRFFDKVASVPKSDWGTRAFMYVYADEPVCNAKTFGTTRYMLKSSAPILDLEGLKQDYGSFKGWMTLNLRKTGKDQTDEVDRYEFEIYDPKHPPKIPRSAWANDARNKKWLDLLPPEKPAPTEGAATMLDAMKVYKEIRNEVKEENPTDAPDSTRSTLETMKLAKELFAPAAADASAAKPADPLTIATELAKTFMQMKADNPMVDFLTKQMDRQHEELMAMRKEIQDRDKTPPVQPKGIVDQLTELAALGDKLDPIKKLLGFSGAAADTVTRTASAKPLDVVRDLGKEFFNSDLSRDIGRWLGSLAERNYQQNPAPNGTHGATAQPRQSITTDPFAKFIEDIVNPKMMMYFNADPSKDGGESFADWIYAGFPEFFTRLQNFEHPRLPGLKGAAAIITGYKNTPHIWNQIGPTREVQFAEFVNGFCEWTRPADEPAEDAEVVEPVSDAPIDFDAQFERETRPS